MLPAYRQVYSAGGSDTDGVLRPTRMNSGCRSLERIGKKRYAAVAVIARFSSKESNRSNLYVKHTDSFIRRGGLGMTYNCIRFLLESELPGVADFHKEGPVLLREGVIPVAEVIVRVAEKEHGSRIHLV